MNRWIVGLVALWGLVAVSGCGKSQGSNEIVVGEYGSMTGSEATFGQGTHKGIMLAVDEVNSSGGVLGKQVRDVNYDDQGDQDQAVTVVKRLIDQDGVCAVLGEVASTNSLAGGGVCQQAKVPMISPSSTNPDVTKGRDYVFRVCFTDDFQGAVGAQLALDKGWKKVAVLTCENSDYSKKLAQFFKEKFQSGGGQIVADETYDKDDKDTKAQLSRIAAANPDAVYLPGYYTNIVLILRQARQDVSLKVPFFGGDGWDSAEVLALGPISDGCFYTNHYSPDDQRPSVQQFIKAYEAKYNGEIPDAFGITGYDAAKVLFDAIKRANSTDPTAIRDALAQTKDFPGAGGNITIDENHNARKPIVVLEIQGGKTHLAETINPQ
ncbi:MAG: ABC transporter substrate-binding protein [Tepidisphaeraceae bacterium]